jgi:two-component system CheB/CheR fusion protein
VAARNWTGEVLHRTKDGRRLTVEATLDLEVLDGRQLVLESTRDVTERKRLEERQELLLGELAHRVKNSLAVVQSIAQQTLRHSPSPQEFVRRFEGRLAALAAAHGLLLRSSWRGADLAKLARLQLKPYAGDERVRMDGPAVILPADLATPFGLVLHELATNAAKHGSLVRPDGRIDLSWTLGDGNDSRRLNVMWEETGGEPPNNSRTNGFGSRLIENGIPNAVVKREFGPSGLRCTIVLELPSDREHAANMPRS